MFVAGGSVAWACCFLQRPSGEGPRLPLLTRDGDRLCLLEHTGGISVKYAGHAHGVARSIRAICSDADSTQPRKRTTGQWRHLEPEAPPREPRGHRPGEPGLRARRGRWMPTPWFYDSQLHSYTIKPYQEVETGKGNCANIRRRLSQGCRLRIAADTSVRGAAPSPERTCVSCMCRG